MIDSLQVGIGFGFICRIFGKNSILVAVTYSSVHIEVCWLKKELADKESQLSVKPAEKAADDELSWLNILSHETGENVQERINLQKALHELEETNLRNRTELQHLDEAIANKQVSTTYAAL